GIELVKVSDLPASNPARTGLAGRLQRGPVEECPVGRRPGAAHVAADVKARPVVGEQWGADRWRRFGRNVSRRSNLRVGQGGDSDQYRDNTMHALPPVAVGVGQKKSKLHNTGPPLAKNGEPERRKDWSGENQHCAIRSALNRATIG